MIEAALGKTDDRAEAGRHRLSRLLSPRAALAVIFFVSGFTALVYQVIWHRFLVLYYGVGSISDAIIVSVFMLGLGVGALAGGWMTERIRRLALVYAAVELGIGAFAVISIPYSEALGSMTAGYGQWETVLPIALFLCVPTFLMGTTLPIAVKIAAPFQSRLLGNLATLYFTNTLGGAAGALVASYVAISAFGLDGTIYVAATTNVALGVLVAIVFRRAANKVEPRPTEPFRELAGTPAAIYALAFLSGFLAIGYEIIWFRVNGVLLKDSPYVFATVLSVYLLALALGSIAVWPVSRRLRPQQQRELFFGINVAVGVTSYMLLTGFFWLSQWPPLNNVFWQMSLVAVMPYIPPDLPFATFADVALRSIASCFIAPVALMFIPVFLMGASFPLVASLLPDADARPGKTTGDAYFAVITGNVAGGLATGFVLLPWLGTEWSLFGFFVAGACFALGCRRVFSVSIPSPMRAAGAAVLVAAGCVAGPARGDVYRALHFPPGPGYEVYIGEGRQGVVVNFRRGEVVTNFINGSSHGYRPGPAYYDIAFTGLSYAHAPRETLVIGFGTGSLVEAVLSDPRVERVTVVEVNEVLIRNLRKIDPVRAVLDDPRVNLVIADGRHYLLTNDKKFGAVFMDPLRSQSSYSNNLFSIEFFQIMRQRLEEGGVLTIWSNEHRIIPRTLASVFDHMEYFAFGTAVASTLPLCRSDADYSRAWTAFQPEMRLGIADLHAAPSADRTAILAATQGWPVNTTYRPITEFFLGEHIRELLAR